MESSRVDAIKDNRATSMCAVDGSAGSVGFPSRLEGGFGDDKGAVNSDDSMLHWK